MHKLRNAFKLFLRKVFEAGQWFGFDLLPRHFYSEIPSISVLKNSEHWRRPYSMIGIAGTDIEQQLQFVKKCCTPAIVKSLRDRNILADACRENGATGFGPNEADFLYAFVSTQRPRQILQIGCGVSTAVCLAASADSNYRPEIICVEPYPTPYLIKAHEEGRIRLIKEKAQCLDLGVIEGLSNDVLFFVDSTHTLGPAGEVSRIVLEMLPRLKPGTWIHFHDILFPYDYSPNILKSALVFWHESILLHAFLAYNNRFVLQASLSMLHHAAQKRLVEWLPNYRPAVFDHGLEVKEGHFPSSAYFRVAT